MNTCWILTLANPDSRESFLTLSSQPFGKLGTNESTRAVYPRLPYHVITRHSIILLSVYEKGIMQRAEEQQKKATLRKERAFAT